MDCLSCPWITHVLSSHAVADWKYYCTFCLKIGFLTFLLERQFSVTQEGRGEFTFVLKLLSRHLPE